MQVPRLIQKLSNWLVSCFLCRLEIQQRVHQCRYDQSKPSRASRWHTDYHVWSATNDQLCLYSQPGHPRLFQSYALFLLRQSSKICFTRMFVERWILVPCVICKSVVIHSIWLILILEFCKLLYKWFLVPVIQLQWISRGLLNDWSISDQWDDLLIQISQYRRYIFAYVRKELLNAARSFNTTSGKVYE